MSTKNYNNWSYERCETYLTKWSALKNGRKVDARTVRKHPLMTDKKFAKMKIVSARYKRLCDDIAKKVRKNADEEFHELVLQRDRDRHAKKVQNENDEDYNRRRELGRKAEAKCRAGRQADPVRSAAVKQRQHDRRTTPEHRARQRLMRASKPEQFRRAQRRHYAKMRCDATRVEMCRQKQVKFNSVNYPRKNPVWDRLLYSAREQDIEMALSKEEAAALGNKLCIYCGIQDDTISGDRIDSNKIYVTGNVVPCCAKCNYMKQGHLPHVFVEMARGIAVHLADPTQIGLGFRRKTKLPSYASWCKQCQKRKKIVDIDKTMYWRLLCAPCVYCGIDRACGIDRRDNNNSTYDASNALSCCSGCNFMKRLLHYDEFLEQVQRIATYSAVTFTVSSSSDWKCAKCISTTRCLDTDFCHRCYWSLHVCKKRYNPAKGTCRDHQRACAQCGVMKQIKFYALYENTICDDCLLLKQ